MFRARRTFKTLSRAWGNSQTNKNDFQNSGENRSFQKIRNIVAGTSLLCRAVGAELGYLRAQGEFARMNCTLKSDYVLSDLCMLIKDRLFKKEIQPQETYKRLGPYRNLQKT